jgi:hypothetical protein
LNGRAKYNKGIRPWEKGLEIIDMGWECESIIPDIIVGNNDIHSAAIVPRGFWFDGDGPGLLGVPDNDRRFWPLCLNRPEQRGIEKPVAADIWIYHLIEFLISDRYIPLRADDQQLFFRNSAYIDIKNPWPCFRLDTIICHPVFPSPQGNEFSKNIGYRCILQPLWCGDFTSIRAERLRGMVSCVWHARAASR